PRYPRSLLPSLEQARLTTSPHCLNRNPEMGPWVPNRPLWYDIAEQHPVPLIARMTRFCEIYSTLL
ncbi:MAG: hypothetical protein OXD42_05990, partial [Rhodospirillaceae bacterium]|nr:hypothetical protein [Rhodospirillaceae bacterium]